MTFSERAARATNEHYEVMTADEIKALPIGQLAASTRSNSEPCLLARRGNPLRLDAGVHSVIMVPVGAHSEKPDEAYARMERLYPGPRLELFARRPREGWTTWGNEIARPGDEAPPPADDGIPACLRRAQP